MLLASRKLKQQPLSEVNRTLLYTLLRKEDADFLQLFFHSTLRMSDHFNTYSFCRRKSRVSRSGVGSF